MNELVSVAGVESEGDDWGMWHIIKQNMVGDNRFVGPVVRFEQRVDRRHRTSLGPVWRAPAEKRVHRSSFGVLLIVDAKPAVQGHRLVLTFFNHQRPIAILNVERVDEMDRSAQPRRQRGGGHLQ